MSSAWTLDHVERVREALAAAAPAVPAPDRPALRRLALLASFRLEDLGDEEAAAVREDSVALVADPARRMLKDGVRRRVLGQLRTRKALAEALLECPDRLDDTLQRAIDSAVTGALPALDSQTPEQLRATLQVADWFADTDIAPTLPPAATLRALLGRESLVGPLRELGGAHFRGRTTELAALRAFVDEEGGREAPPLLIFGAGGMGKSTLVARFILESVGRIPLAYLDCDRPGIVAMEPVTLLAEIVRQLALQFPGLDSAAARLRGRWLAKLAADGEVGTGPQAPVTVGRETVMKEFKLFLDTLPAGERRMLLVVDTFEEVQYRSRALVAEIFIFLAELQALMPSLRTVIAGRNRVPGLRYVPLEIGPLDLESARAILASLGVSPESAVEALGCHLAGNPLSLRLAAELWCETRGAGLGDIAAIADEVDLQGTLYGRILAHLHDDQVRDIAHPGLILRRITPEIIERVLAGPCGLGPIDQGRAQELFGLLRDEMSLVVPEDEDSVRHRRDVRRIMLRPLRRARATTVREIEEAAIRYYLQFDDPVSRAEEIYHRLSLGQPPAAVEPRWIEGVDESLRFAIDELEGESRAYLAARLGIELYDVDLDILEQSTWELMVARQAADLLELDRPREAVELLRRRSTRLPGSPLHWFLAQALRQGGLLPESRQVARVGLAELVGEGAEAISRAATERLIDWYSGSELAAPPDLATVERQRRIFLQEQALEQRASPSFAGRHSEMAALHSYVSSPSTAPLRQRRPLFIQGPGGSGKTALVAQYLMQQGSNLVSLWVRGEAALGASATSTVYSMAMRQIVGQLERIFPGVDLAELKSLEPHGLSDSDRDFAASRFGTALRQMEVLASGEKPLLVVVDDTQDIAQFEYGLWQMFELLASIGDSVPRLRAVFLGRSVPPDKEFDVLTIGGLDAQSAESLLLSENVDREDVRAAILRESAGHPLTMHLMIRLYRERGELPASDSQWRDGLGESLLNRLTSDIADPELARILPPALLLRRIDPKVLRAAVCEIADRGPTSQAEADILFRKLAHEAAFVSHLEELLIPKRDVRLIVARTLRRSRPDLAHAVDRAAIAFYRDRVGHDYRAEEIYHRLAAGEDPRDVDLRWESGVEYFLEDAAEEFEGPARAYLDAKLDRDPAGSHWLDADQETWEAHAATRSEGLRQLNRHDEALELLRKRSARLPRSGLYAVEGTILTELGRLHEALAVVEDGLHGLPDDAELLALRERLRHSLGVEEVAPSHDGADPERGALRKLVLNALRRSGREPLVDALAETLATSLDLVSAWRHFDIASRIDAGQPAHLLVSQIVDHAASQGYLEDLVVAAFDYAPQSPLRDLVEGRHNVRASGAEPSRERRVEGGLIFNRLILRRFIAGLQDPTRRQPLLFVVGPPGSGKSSTGRIARRFAGEVGEGGRRCRIHEMAIGDNVSPDQLANTFFATFEWRWEEVEPLEPASERRDSVDYAQMVVDRFKRLESGGRHDLLIVSATDRLRSDSRDMLDRLIGAGHGPAFILVGLTPVSSPYLTGDALVEILGDFSPEDIKEGLERFLRENEIEADSDLLCQAIMEKAAGKLPFNAEVSRIAHELIAGLLRGPSN